MSAGFRTWQNSLQSKEQERATLRAEWQTVKQQIQDLTIIIEQERDLASYRQQLQAGDACPLCGATDHPAIDHSQPVDVPETQQRLQALQQKKIEIEAQGEQLKEHITKLSYDITQAQNQLTELAQVLTQQQQEWQQYSNSVSLTIDINNYDIDSLIASQIQQYEQRHSDLEQHKALTKELAALEKQQANTNQSADKLQHQQALYAQQQQQQQTLVHDCKQELASLQQHIDSLEIGLKQYIDVLPNVAEQTVLETFNSSGKLGNKRSMILMM